MKLVYITSKKFPSNKVDPVFVQSMAEAYTELLEDNFSFLVRGSVVDQLKHTNATSVYVPRRGRVLMYSILLPILTIFYKWNNRETIILSYDPYLLPILIFWRKVFKFKYGIVSDWHQLFDDWRDIYIAKNSDYLITTSSRLKNLLVSKCHVDQGKILVAYGGVDTSLFVEKMKKSKHEYREILGLPKNSFLVGYIGGFRSVGLKKGLDIMIEALPNLDEKIIMVFVGGTKTHIDEYVELAQKVGVEDRCIFVSKQPFDKVIEYEMAMDIISIPYPDKHHFREYGFPMKVWEYMASGRPIIYSNLDIIGEILAGRGTSFKPDDSKSFADAVSGICDNLEVAEQVGRKNQKDISNYTWRKRAEHILNFISI